MKKLYVYADFDWLKEMELVGELGYESLRGSDSYSFSFNDEWLRKHGDLFLSYELHPRSFVSNFWSAVQLRQTNGRTFTSL